MFWYHAQMYNRSLIWDMILLGEGFALSSDIARNYFFCLKLNIRQYTKFVRNFSNIYKHGCKSGRSQPNIHQVVGKSWKTWISPLRTALTLTIYRGDFTECLGLKCVCDEIKRTFWPSSPLVCMCPIEIEHGWRWRGEFGQELLLATIISWKTFRNSKNEGKQSHAYCQDIEYSIKWCWFKTRVIIYQVEMHKFKSGKQIFNSVRHMGSGWCKPLHSCSG